MTEQLKKAYKLFTEGKFTNALQGFNQVLWTIPMVVVDSRKEVDEVKELITICRSLQFGTFSSGRLHARIASCGFQQMETVCCCPKSCILIITSSKNEKDQVRDAPSAGLFCLLICSSRG